MSPESITTGRSNGTSALCDYRLTNQHSWLWIPGSPYRAALRADPLRRPGMTLEMSCDVCILIAL